MLILNAQNIKDVLLFKTQMMANKSNEQEVICLVHNYDIKPN